MSTLAGSCHCGNLTLAFQTAMHPREFSLRSCRCSYCARHGARTVTDPEGGVEIRAERPGEVIRYEFGPRTAQFLVCGRCGVYVGAVMVEGERAWATVNANVLDCRDELPERAEPIDYSGEDPEARRARRRARWTPAVLRMERPGCARLDDGVNSNPGVE